MDEKHDVITAEDMKQALESHGGLRGCRAAVVEVDTTKAVGNDNKIPGISLINNFLLSEAEFVLGRPTTLDLGTIWHMTSYVSRNKGTLG